MQVGLIEKTFYELTYGERYSRNKAKTNHPSHCGHVNSSSGKGWFFIKQSKKIYSGMKKITRQELVDELVKNYGWSNLHLTPFAHVSPIMILEDVVLIVNKIIDKKATNKDL